jgi:hypothetical protein
MRLTKLISWVLWCGTFAFFTDASHAQATSRIAGRVVVAKAEGDVMATNLVDQSERKLVANDVIGQNYRVITGTDSQAILVFSNGATLNLGSNSDLSIEEFLQDPFDDNVALADLKEEPASSTTRLNLSRGELVGNVKRLRPERGSSFIVKTPVGAAGIRGTTFRIVFRPDANGTVTFTLSTSEGVILFQAPDGAGVSVETGREVVVDVEVTVNAGTGTATVVSAPAVTGTQDIPAATQATIATAAQQIIEVSQDVILSTTPTPAPSAGASPPNTTPESTTQAENAAEQQETPAPPANGQAPFTPSPENAPVITTPPPDVTPGAGAN